MGCATPKLGVIIIFNIFSGKARHLLEPGTWRWAGEEGRVAGEDSKADGRRSRPTFFGGPGGLRGRGALDSSRTP
jgi:hypothetical protein